MKDIILALLVAQFAGVRKDGLAQMANALAFQATTEDEAKGLVEKLTKAQVDTFIKDFRADVDKEVSESNKTYETNLKKKFDLVEKKEPDKVTPNKTTDPNDIATIVANAVASAVAPLQEKLSGFEQGNIAKSRLQTLTEKLGTCKDETFKARILKDFGRMNLTDEEFVEYLTETETDIATANQNVANNAMNDQARPYFSQKNDDGVSAGVASFIESQNQDSTTGLGGKEV